MLGIIGHLMAGTGLKELLETIYTYNAVGQAILIARHGHFLIDAALNALLMSESFGIQLLQEDDQDNQQDSTTDPDLQAIENVYDEVMAKEKSVEELKISEILEKVETSEALEKVREKGRRDQRITVALWLQYMKMINILQKFIKAEKPRSVGTPSSGCI